MIGRDRGSAGAPRASRQHLHRVQLRQRPAHRRVPADAGQADRLRHRHPRPARGHRPGGPARDDAPTRWPRTSIWPRRSRRIGGTDLAGRRPQPGRRCCTAAGAADWRDAVLVEHQGPRRRSSIRTSSSPRAAARPPTRRCGPRDFLYVEYADGEREFYDLRSDPFELHNVAARLTRSQSELLHSELQRLKRCHGERRCWSAMHVRDRAPGDRPPDRRDARLPARRAWPTDAGGACARGAARGTTGVRVPDSGKSRSLDSHPDRLPRGADHRHWRGHCGRLDQRRSCRELARRLRRSRGQLPAFGAVHLRRDSDRDDIAQHRRRVEGSVSLQRRDSLRSSA